MLIHCRRLSVEETLWEDLEGSLRLYPILHLEDKVFVVDRGNDIGMEEILYETRLEEEVPQYDPKTEDEKNQSEKAQRETCRTSARNR